MAMNDTFKKFEETLLLNCIADPSYAKKMLMNKYGYTMADLQKVREKGKSDDS
jgi:hypothetical protein